MKLLFIYGPAAVGKLTVAKELAKLTGYTIFDNHLSIDYAARLLEWNTPDYVKLLRGIRLFTFQKMAEIGVEGLIFTFVYTPPGSNEFVRQVLEVCASSNIEPVFVKLEARREVLLERVVNPERKAHKKLSKPERMIQMLDEQRALEAIPFVQSIVIDTSDQPPKRSAGDIQISGRLLSAKVLRVIRQLYPDHQAEVRGLLERHPKYGGMLGIGGVFSEELNLVCLVFSEGKLESLKSMVDTAHTDFGDVLQPISEPYYSQYRQRFLELGLELPRNLR